jgi:diaminohydroxyphosphoribosylaminopyrimidine deaminase / 5-amino-6-(5-phosphoribosylamino)uracil reductase
MASTAETAAMRRAVALAATAGTPTGPNPRVGAVVLHTDGTQIAGGYHRGAGTAHAEVDALAAAGSRARGSTVVVTLEPCTHTGRTGPCTQALLAAGVARVVYGQQDTSPAARGGADQLRAAGVEVEGGLLADEAAQLNPVFTFAAQHARPYVTFKTASTLDGRVAAADGTSRWITSAAARADGHRLRAEVDAVLVGTGTALADDPALTARPDDTGPLPSARQPLRVVVGDRPLPATARVLDSAAATLLLPRTSPGSVLAALHQHGVAHVLLEGGPTLAGAFVEAHLVDRVVAYLAPALLGAGPTVLGPAGISTIAETLRLHTEDVCQLGPDVRITARAHREGQG